jgi:hypothetical protein
MSKQSRQRPLIGLVLLLLLLLLLYTGMSGHA